MNRWVKGSALIIGMSLALAGCCGEDISKVMDVAKGGINMINEMQNAPEAIAAKGAGCEQAFYVTPEGLKKFVKLVAPDDKKLACNKVAAAVTESGKVKRKFAVTVTQQGKDKPICDGMYDKDGKHLGSVPKDQQDALKNMKLGKN